MFEVSNPFLLSTSSGYPLVEHSALVSQRINQLKTFSHLCPGLMITEALTATAAVAKTHYFVTWTRASR